jgi:hypothetical protein
MIVCSPHYKTCIIHRGMQIHYTFGDWPFFRKQHFRLARPPAGRKKAPGLNLAKEAGREQRKTLWM